MNTAIQVKTHTPQSAKMKSQHNERKDESIKNPKFEIVYKNIQHKYHYTEPIQAPKKTQAKLSMEKENKAQISRLNAKISNYEKRLVDYQLRLKPNYKQIEKLRAKLIEAKIEKAKIPKQIDRRGKPQTQKYIEFEISLTNSRIEKNSREIRALFEKSVQELHKDKIFENLKPIHRITHLDQHSLHQHSMNKLVNGKSWNSIIKAKAKELNPSSKYTDGREAYTYLQNKFNDIVRKNMKELGIEIEKQQRGITYLPLKKYKEKTNFKSNENENEYEKIIQKCLKNKELANKTNIKEIFNKKEDKKEPNQAQKELKKMSLKQNDFSKFKKVQEEIQEQKEAKAKTKKHYRSR